jgi:hypothetical protein
MTMTGQRSSWAECMDSKAHVGKRLVASLGHGLLWLVLAYIICGLIVRHRYVAAWEKTAAGDSVPTVISRFGGPDTVESALRYSQPDFCARPDQKCDDRYAFRFWYELPFTAFVGGHVLVIEFDDRQRVVDKVEMRSP